MVYLAIAQPETSVRSIYRVGDTDAFTALLQGGPRRVETSVVPVATDTEILEKLNKHITYGAGTELCSYSIPLGADAMVARAELNRVLTAAIDTYQQQLQPGQVLELVIVTQTEERVEKLLRITQTAQGASSQNSGRLQLRGTLFSPIPMIGFGTANGSLNTSSTQRYESNQGVTMDEFIHSLQHASVYIAIKSQQ